MSLSLVDSLLIEENWKTFPQAKFLNSFVLIPLDSFPNNLLVEKFVHVKVLTSFTVVGEKSQCGALVIRQTRPGIRSYENNEGRLHHYTSFCRKSV